jgi:hypothetical protein
VLVSIELVKVEDHWVGVVGQRRERVHRNQSRGGGP